MSNNFYFTNEKFFIDENLIQYSNEKFKKIFENDEYKTNDKNIREIPSNLIFRESIFEEIMKKLHLKFQEIINSSDLRFNKLWLVNSIPNETKKTFLPYVPHIDYKRFFKVMIYLHDVNLENGPIHLGKTKNNIDIEQIRKKLPNDYKDKGLNIISKDQIEGNLIPMLGNAGDAIFFDTNTPHKAGQIKSGYYRKVLRFDFERPSLNSRINIFKKFKLDLLIKKFLNK